MRALNIKAGIELIRNNNTEFMIPKIPLPTNINKQNLAPLPFDIFHLRADVPFLERSEKEIKTLLRRIIEGIHMDNGAEARVFLIPDTNYIVRVPLKKNPQMTEPLTFDISVQDRINHYIAKIGDKVQIGEYIEGTNCIVPHKAPNKTVLQRQINEKIVQMPLSAYQSFLKSLGDAFKLNMAFDYHGRNVIVSESRNLFVPLDFEYGFSTRCKNSSFNPIAEMQMGFSVKDEDLQYKFTNKILHAFGDLLLSNSKLPKNEFANIEMGAKLDPFGFNLSKLKDPYQFADRLNVLNTALQSALGTRKMYELNPMFCRFGEVKDEVKSLKELSVKYFGSLNN